MYRKSFCLTLLIMITVLVTVAGADWVAYNDLSDGNNGTATLGLNVSTYTYLDTNKPLINFQTGAVLPVTMTGEVVGDGDANGDVYPNNGDNCNPGTEADEVFGGILDLTGGNELDTTAEHKAIIFNGLNPAMSYTITLTSNRGNASYTNRWSKVTIEGADTYTYAASAGVVKLSEASGEFCVGYNSVDGYVMKWTDISCGADGSFSIKSENANHGGKGYAMMAFKLEEFALGNATDPSPANKATDVPRDLVLSWTPGIYAPPVNGHRIYLGKSFNDVNDGTGGAALDVSSYNPGRLDLGSTYYWRIDEVNAPPDSTVYKGEVWSFTTEPVGYPIDGANITATASSSGQAGFGPENTINGSGLDENDLHSTEAMHMWLSANEPMGAWIRYDFDKVHKLYEMWVWNSNQVFEALFGFGLKGVTVEYSTDGAAWMALADVPEFGKGTGTADYAHNTVVHFGGAAAKSVKLTANSNWGGVLPQYSLSEIRFFSIPVSAREPSPDSGASDVTPAVTLAWRAGRQAGTHDVYLSTDEQAVIDGTAPAVSVTDTSYSSDLDLASTYYWRVDEVNDNEATTTWQGDVWDFTTQESIVVDDFEDYNDYPPYEIYSTWVDGYEIPTNGSQVGNLSPPLAETMIVHGGNQSMPIFYSNTGGATYSESQRTSAAAQNWTRYGITTLSIWFRGTVGNTGQMYVKINNTKIPYNGAAANITLPGWQLWNIDLATSKASLQSVTSLAIGMDGNGAAGTLYFDDIALYAVPPVPVVEVTIAEENNDVEERIGPNNGAMDRGSSDLEMPYEDSGQVDPQIIGLRFTGIAIPQGATITDAWVQFTVDETKGGTQPVNLIIEGELSPSAAGFSSTAGDVSSRPKTSAKVQWSVPNWTNVGDDGPDQRTPNLTSIIQEIVNQNGWTGEALVLVLRDDPANPSTGIRCAGIGGTVVLHIDYQ